MSTKERAEHGEHHGRVIKRGMILLAEFAVGGALGAVISIGEEHLTAVLEERARRAHAA